MPGRGSRTGLEDLAHGLQGAGVHHVSWDARDVPAGIYFVRLESAGLRRTMRLVVVR